MTEIRFKASPKLYGYLAVLVRDTMLGSSVNDVAEKLLTIEAERRLLERYHEHAVPTASSGAGE